MSDHPSKSYTAKIFTAQELYRHTDPNALPDTLDKHADDKSYDHHDFGQIDALTTIKNALFNTHPTQHIFVTGEAGLGKRTAVIDLLNHHTATHPHTPYDWLLLPNFDDPKSPITIPIKAATGCVFIENLTAFWQKLLKTIINKAIQKTHQKRLFRLKNTHHNTQNQHIDEFNQHISQYNLKLLPNFRLYNPHTLSKNYNLIFEFISAQTKTDKATLEQILPKLIQLSQVLDTLDNQHSDACDDINHAIIDKYTAPLFDAFISTLNKYIPNNQSKNHNVLDNFIKSIQSDILNNASAWVDWASNLSAGFWPSTVLPAYYNIQLIVHNNKTPIVMEDLPSQINLMGYLDASTVNDEGMPWSIQSPEGVTRQFTKGALLRANGGYLVMDAHKLLSYPNAWQSLKHALQTQSVGIATREQLDNPDNLPASPIQVALSLKVILLGDFDSYFELFDGDPDFAKLFSVRADFRYHSIRNEASEIAMCHKIRQMQIRHHLTALDNTALAKVLERLSCIANHQNKLDLNSQKLLSLLLKIHQICTQNNLSIANANTVNTALNAQKQERCYIKDLYFEDLINGQQLTTTTGSKIGQVNALTVIEHAGVEFGLPSVVSAVIAPKYGSGDIVDIERDVNLGGNLHAKGMLIMAGFLRAKFSTLMPMNFTASIAFEQNYTHIDGDSATLAEACALLSALANVPIAQNIAITGSMNQLGQVQAVGGINQKITGFFEMCQIQELTGKQGVIIPLANRYDLMLDDAIIDAINKGKFVIYGVNHLEEALEILFNMPIDTKNKKGKYKGKSLFGKIIKRLNKFA